MLLIHQLAKRTQISIDSIRFYEKKQLLQPALKAENGYRYYDEKNVQTIFFIKNCRHLDISIEEIRQLLQLVNQQQNSCQTVDTLIENHIINIENKIEQLISFKQQLSSLRQRCKNSNTIETCQILKGLTSSI